MNALKRILKEKYSIIILFAILFLFFFQTLSDLVERIYAYALLNLEPDENILGLVFLLTPIALLFFRKQLSNLLLLILGETMILARLLEPLMVKQMNYIMSGITIGCFLILFPAFLLKSRNEGVRVSKDLGIGLAIAVALSILFRTANATLDISQYSWYQVIGWILGIIASLIMFALFFNTKNNKLVIEETEETEAKSSFWKILGLSMGLINIFIIIWFVFMSPTVISRWTDGNYIGIVIGIMFMLLLFIAISLWKPDIATKIKSWMIWTWNGIFGLSLTITILVHQIFFPRVHTAYPLEAPMTLWYYHIPLVIAIITSPIIYLDFKFLTRELIKIKPKPIKIGGSFLINGIFIIIMIFVQILPNVWGYLPPISYGFRDMYWLAFFIPTLIISLTILLVKKTTLTFEKIERSINSKIILSSLFGLIFVGTILGAILTTPSPNYSASGKTSLVILTYNIQQGVNVSGDQNYDGQLQLIRDLDPDIIGLQECDPTRISGGNQDVVRYFASQLNMYSYYGPKTVTNTYGCAILSKFPLSNTESFFMYSDQEQIGSAQAQITVGTTKFNVFVNHPAGDEDQTTIYQQEEMLSKITGLSNIIFMGDFNFRPYSIEYNMTISILEDSYAQFYGIPAVNLSGIDPNDDEYNAIDHIFLSAGMTVLDAQYIEKGHSDHPAYWIEIEL